MQENTLLRVSFIIAVAGLGGMLFISTIIEIPITPAGTLTPDDIGRYVKVCGELKDKFTSKNSHTFFNLVDDSGSIRTVAFNSTGISTTPRTGCVIGRLDLYKGELEIIAQGVVDD